MPRVFHNHLGVSANHSIYQTELSQSNQDVLQQIATNTANINLNVDTVEVSVDALEVLQAETNTKLAAQKTVLDSMLVDTDAIDSSCNTIEAQSVLTASRLNNIQNKLSVNVDGSGDTLGQINTNILAKNTEIESSLDTLIAANHTDLVAVEASLTSMEGKIDTLDTVQDNALAKLTEIATNTANINVNVGDVEVNTNDLEVLQASTNSKLDSILAKNGEIETSADALIAANHTDLVALEGSLTSMEGKQDDIKTLVGATNTLLGTNNSGLTSINSGISDLDTLLGDIQTDNNNKSDHLSSDLDTLNSKIDTLTAKIKLANSDAHLAVSLEDIGGVATQTTSAAILAKNGEIETTADAILAKNTEIETTADAILAKNTEIETTADAILAKNTQLESLITSSNSKLDHLSGDLDELETSANAIQAALEGTLTVGTHAVTNAGTFAVQSTVAAALPAGDNNIGNVDIASALPAGSNAIGKLAQNSGVDIGDVDVTSISTGSNRIGMVGLKANQAADGSGTERFVLCDAAGHLQVDVLSGGGSTDVSAVATHAKQDTIIGHLDGVEGKLDAIETTNNACQVLLGTIDADTGAIKTAVQILDNAISGNEMQVDIVTSALPSGAATQTTLASVLAKNTEIETTADAILAKNTEIETTADAILAKNTELETLLTSIAPRTATATLSAATNLADGAALAIVDTAGYRYMTIFGRATNDVDLHIQYSLTNSAGAMISLYNEAPYKLQSVSSINNITTFNTTIEHMARYVRFINFSGNQINALTLYYQLSN